MTTTRTIDSSDDAAQIQSPADVLAEAEQLFSTGSSDEARVRLEALLPRIAGDPQLHVQVVSDLAVIAARRGSLEEAATFASEALAASPGHIPALEVLTFCTTARQHSAGALSSGKQGARVEEFRRLSTCLRVQGEPIREQPVLLLGRGRICFGDAVQFGWHESPGFYDRYAYIEASHPGTVVEIGENTFFNNGATLRSEGPGISVGTDCLFGWNVEILDSDFHDLHPRRRRSGTPLTGRVAIGNNVFVGSNTMVMKGVTIGDDTVVGAASVVLHSLPAGVIAGGNPARVIRALEEQ